MSKETPKRVIKSMETKMKIYESANYLFRLHGVDNVSIDSIVEMAGVSKGTFYVHFESKYSLIALLINDFVNKLDLDYRSCVESFPDNTPASEIIVKLVEVIADIIVNTIGYDLMKNVYEALITRSLNSDSILGYDRDLYNIFRSVISKGIEQGEFKKQINIDSIVHHLVLALRGITFEWCVRYPELNYKQQALEHFEILLMGIKEQ